MIPRYENAKRELNTISKLDIDSSATINLFRVNPKLFISILEVLDKKILLEREKMIDLGCGYGGLAKLIGKCFEFKEVYGLDIDHERLAVAKERGIHTYKCNLEKEKFPFPDNFFSLVTSFGVLEHLTYFDNILEEAYRVLKSGGVFLLSAPNLGSWANRLSLLLGCQPRNLEISRFKIVGVHNVYHKIYRRVAPVGHISSCTLKAIIELLNFYGFKILKCWGTGIVPAPDVKLNLTLKIFDKLLSKKATLSVRFIIASQKS